MPLYLGIDLCNHPTRPWAWATLGEDRSLREAGWVEGRPGAQALALRLRPSVVAVDAPLGLPLGMDCLEPSCPCQPTSGLPGRACERELAHQGIGLFFTTKRSLIKQMVYEAIALRKHLQAHGIRVVEVYPYSVRRLLLGRHAPHKRSAQGQKAMRDALAPLIPGLERLPQALGHDGLDALLAALVGWLWSHGLTKALGREEEGVLVLPVDDFVSRLGI